MTRKLYYEDSHIREFDARVISCEERGGKFEIVLDKTAFFPEGGGNPADTGTLGGCAVTYALERGGEVVHLCTGPFSPGSAVHGEIDWEKRFSNMQNHTAEHIVSGIVHRRHGFDNVGFHMGADGVIVDFDGFVDDMELSDIEREANEVVWRNVAVTESFPAPEELSSLTYRSKLDLRENVRLVTIEGVDVCACCAPHVKRTGEVGVIKIFESIRRKDGVRIRMLAGDRAYGDYVRRAQAVSRISAMLSAKREAVAEAVERLLAERDALSYELGGLKRQMIQQKVDITPETVGDIVAFEPSFDVKELQLLANSLSEKCGGVAAAFAGGDGEGYKYVIASRHVDLRPWVREFNTSLNGRGGGKPELVTGTVKCESDKIKEYFRRDK